MTSIMVAGATGTVGRRLVKELITAGYTVTAVSRNEERLYALRAVSDERRLKLAACDLADTEAASNLSGKVFDIDALVHFASTPPANEHDHRSCTDQVIMSINLIALFGDKIEHAIIGSCTSVCGDGEKEHMPTTPPDFPTTYHGSSLQAMEKLWNLYAADSGKPVTCIRFAPTSVHGPNELGSESESGTSGIGDISRMILEALEAREGGLVTLY